VWRGGLGMSALQAWARSEGPWARLVAECIWGPVTSGLRLTLLSRWVELCPPACSALGSGSQA
jgi:hypothetical protein